MESRTHLIPTLMTRPFLDSRTLALTSWVGSRFLTVTSGSVVMNDPWHMSTMTRSLSSLAAKPQLQDTGCGSDPHSHTLVCIYISQRHSYIDLSYNTAVIGKTSKNDKPQILEWCSSVVWMYQCCSSRTYDRQMSNNEDPLRNSIVMLEHLSL